MVGRTRRDGNAIAAALGVGAVVEPEPVLDQLVAFGLSKRVDRELRKERTGRDGWRGLDENTMTAVLGAHPGARVALLGHPNGRVRMAAVQQSTDRAFPTGTLRTLVHRCADSVDSISAVARETVSAALAGELERPDRGALSTPVAYAVTELRSSADLVLQCPALVIVALELTSTSWRPHRRLTLRATHQYDQLAEHLRTMAVTTEASELARQQLFSWLREQVTVFGRTVIDESEQDR